MSDDDNKTDAFDDDIDFGADDGLDDIGADFSDDFGDDFDGDNGDDGNTLGDLWRNNPLVKVGVILIAAAIIFGIILMFGGGDKQDTPSVVTGGSDVSATPGETGATRDFIEAIQESNENAAEEALLTGGSALPVPIESPTEILEPKQPEQTDGEDPLDRWRRLQEEREAEQNTPLEQRFDTQIIQQEIDTGAAEAMEAMASAMSQQMQAILENQTDAQVSHRTINSQAYLDTLEEEKKAAAEEQAAQVEQEQVVQTILLPAGEILYGQLITEANSDTPGPVVAQIVSGPLKGSRILGDFSVQKELLTLNFNTVVIDGQSIPINAIALDPNTTLPGMATEVDHRYLTRIILPAAAAFIEGTADAIEQSGLTTVTVTGETVTESTGDTTNEQEISAGVSEAGREIGTILDDIANETEVLVRIHAGTPLGVLFLEPVVEGDDGSQNPLNNLSGNLDVLPQ